MNINDTVIKYDEKVIFALRELYSKYGYSQYKMSKFEEYDLYARNKDFLTSLFQPEPTYRGDAIPISGNGDLTND